MLHPDPTNVQLRDEGDLLITRIQNGWTITRRDCEGWAMTEFRETVKDVADYLDDL